MKQAKTEAAQVVEKYKADKEEEFRSKASSTNVNAEAGVLEEQTAADIAQMKVSFEKNKQVLLMFLI